MGGDASWDVREKGKEVGNGCFLTTAKNLRKKGKFTGKNIPWY